MAETMSNRNPLDLIEVPSLPTVYHIGPPLTTGALPSVFYFSLSGQESLNLDPYNQPAVYLANQNIRVFSITLPEHFGTHPHPHAMNSWAASIASGFDFMKDFVADCSHCIDYFVDKGYVSLHRIGSCGLSRGGFAATHLAAHDKRIKYVVGFAPITNLAALKEFNAVGNMELCHRLSLTALIPQLTNVSLRFYIGNRDTCVNTSDCYEFIHKLTEAAHQLKRRSLPIELTIYPSIGHKGHGTPPEIFRSGADWLLEKLNFNS